MSTETQAATHSWKGKLNGSAQCLTMDVLRRLVKEADDPNCVVLAERAINDYLQPEIDALKAVI